MGKAVKIIATAALVVGASIVTFNPGTGAAIAGALSAASGVAISTAAVITAAGVASSIGIAGLQRNLMGGASRAALSVFDPASINPDKNAFRKISFGRTLFTMDLRYAEPSADAEQAYFEYVFALAGHRCESLEQIYIDEKLAWSVGAATGEFANYLWVEFIPEAGPSAYHTVHGGTKWAANQRLTGCATMKVRIRRTALNKNSTSPFTNGLYGRWSAIGKGMPVYDPALDSTVPGGSGDQRANDCTTWRYTAGGIDRGNNPALQELAYFLGWTCMGKTMVGLGIAASLFNLPSFAVGAAISDEAIAIVGGSQRRYESGRTFSDGDDPKGVRDELNQAMNAELVHDGGKLALRLGVNDLIPQITLTEDDFLSGYSWEALPQRDAQYTVVRGRFTQPGAPALFQMADIPEVLTGMASVAPRPLAVDLSPVQNIIRGERIITQIARRVAWNGRFRVRLGIRSWAMHQNIVCAVDIPHREWDGKLFRARVLALNNDCTVDVELRPEVVDIYLPPSTPTGNITPENPIPILSQNMLGWLAAGLAPGATRNVGRGPWASGEDYDVGDFVSSGGNAYECVTAHTSSGGDEPPSAFWQLLIPGGTAGVDGDNVAVVTIYKRAAVAPAGPSGNLIFDFNGTLTEATGGAANGWTLEHQDSDGNPEWSRQAGARNAGASDTITPGEWSVSKKVVQDGAPGTPGLNSATITIYARGASAPAAPTGTFTYTFATAVLSGGALGSWSQGVPAVNGQPLWVMQATASNTTATDTIPAGEFSASVKMVEDGTAGAPGLNSAIVTLYRRAASTPSDPTGTFTYTFATAALSGGTLNGWTQAIPATDGNPLWVKQASAVASTATDTIAAAEFAAAVKIVEDGGAGAPGLNSATARIYQRGASAPAGPSATATYTFSNGALTGLDAGWSATVPAVNGQPLWTRQATASSTGATDTIAAGEWSASVKMVEDGGAGAPGLSIAATPSVMNVGLFADGSPKPGELPQTTQLILFDGSTDVTTSGSYSVIAQSNCTASHVSNGQFNLSAVTALPASFTVQAAYGGKTISMKISIAAPKDGPAASRNGGTLGAPNSSGSLVSIGSVDLVVAAGATIIVSGSLTYRATTSGGGTRTVQLAAAVSVENLTDSGSPSMSSEVGGSTAVYITGDGDSEVGQVACEASFTNGTGVPKTFRGRFYTRKISGNAAARTGGGDFEGPISISAA